MNIRVTPNIAGITTGQRENQGLSPSVQAIGQRNMCLQTGRPDRRPPTVPLQTA